MRSRPPRALGATAVAVALIAGLTSCSEPVTGRNDVAATIQAELAKQHLTADAVTCPDDLKMEVGQSVHCGFTVDGQPVDAIATVTSVDGGKAHLAITTDARPIAKDLLARKVGEQLARRGKMRVETATCEGDLEPTVNATQACAVTSQGTDMKLTVTVTKVDGGLITYSVQQL